MDAEVRLHLAEEERDVYKVLSRRYQLRLESTFQRASQNGRENDAIEEDEAGEESDDERSIMVPLNGREQAVIFGLGAMLRSIHNESGDDDDDDDGDDDAGNEEDNVDPDPENQDSYGVEAMEEDSSRGDQEEYMAEQEAESSVRQSLYFPMGSEAMSLSSSPNEMIVRPQARTVSITSEDF